MQPNAKVFSLRYLAGISLLAFLYYFTARIGIDLSFGIPYISTIWIPDGIGLAAFLMFGFRFWPGIALGRMLFAHFQGASIFLTLGFAADSCLTTLFSAWLLKRTDGFDVRLKGVRPVMIFLLLGVFLAPWSSASIRLLLLEIQGWTGWPEFIRIFCFRGFGNSLGILLLTPFILSLGNRAHSPRGKSEWIEGGVLYFFLSGATILVFSGHSLFGNPHYPLALLPIPLLLWAAMRFDLRIVSLCNLTVGAIAILGTLSRFGPFAMESPVKTVILLSFYLYLVSVTSLLISAVIAERKEVECMLGNAREVKALALKGGNLGLWDWNRKTGEYILDKRAGKMLGYGRGQSPRTLGAWLERVHPLDKKRALAAWNTRWEEGREFFRNEFRMRTRSGDFIWVHTHAKISEWDEEGKPYRITGTYQDITARKELEEEILKISDREQRRIGHDLHDGICQQLAGIDLLSQSLEDRLILKSKVDAAFAARISSLLQHANSETRDLAKGLSPVLLQPEGLMAALEDLSAGIINMFPVACRFHCLEPILIHNNGIATHLFRIAQEAVNNAVKHGSPSRVEIRLYRCNGKINLEVEDDGLGMGWETRKNKGMGLQIMRYRSSIIGGSFEIRQNAMGGTTLSCSLERDILKDNRNEIPARKTSIEDVSQKRNSHRRRPSHHAARAYSTHRPSSRLESPRRS